LKGCGHVYHRLEGKCKASPDEDLPDRHGTVHGLRQQAGAQASAVADLVLKAIEEDVSGHL